jgi:hypothetical protein
MIIRGSAATGHPRLRAGISGGSPGTKKTALFSGGGDNTVVGTGVYRGVLGARNERHGRVCGIIKLVDNEARERVTDIPSHRYLSTSCLHAADPGREGLHEYCKSATGSNGDTDWVKIPASCKFCGTACVCACHGEMEGEPPSGGLPAAAVAAATECLLTGGTVVDMLNAAVPHLGQSELLAPGGHGAAAERERIRLLALTKRAVYCKACDGAPCDHDDELAPFADLLVGGGSSDGGG